MDEKSHSPLHGGSNLIPPPPDSGVFFSVTKFLVVRRVFYEKQVLR